MLGLGCQQCPLPSPHSASDRKVINTDEAIIRLVLVLCCASQSQKLSRHSITRSPPPAGYTLAILLHYIVVTYLSQVVRRNREDELFGEGSVYFLLYSGLCRGPEYLELAAARRGRSTGRIMVPLQHCSTAAGSSAAVYCSNSISQRGKNPDHFIISSLKNASQFKMHLRIANELSRLRRRV